MNDHSRHYRRAIIFTGHMVDLPSRSKPRFPPSLEALASSEIQSAISGELATVNAPDVIAISSLARGGDILFQEQVKAHNIENYLVLPFAPEVFVDKSVSGVPNGNWEQRFWQTWNGTPPKRREILTVTANANPYELCNQRQLEVGKKAAEEIALIALSDGTADGAGGTQDLIRRVRDLGGRIALLDVKRLLALNSA